MLLLLLACAPEPACADGWCELADGRFALVEPDTPTGQAVLVFHGWGTSPRPYVNDTNDMAIFTDAGWTVLLPEGRDGAWNVTNLGVLSGSWRDEIAFVDEILDFAEGELALDTFYATGVSVGSAVVSELGCQRSERFAAISPMHGTFWEPLPTRCDTRIPVRQVHGLNDTTWPIDGQTFLGPIGQGSEYAAMDIWAEANGCAASFIEEQDILECTVMDCANGEVRLCTHDGGHSREDGWAGRLVGWVDTLP